MQASANGTLHFFLTQLSIAELFSSNKEKGDEGEGGGDKFSNNSYISKKLVKGPFLRLRIKTQHNLAVQPSFKSLFQWPRLSFELNLCPDKMLTSQLLKLMSFHLKDPYERLRKNRLKLLRCFVISNCDTGPSSFVGC